MKKFYLHVLIFSIVLFLSLSVITTSHAATYIHVDDGVYDIFTRLDAEGVITGGLLSTKPLSRKTAERLLREAEANLEGRSEFIKGLVAALRQRLGPSGAEAGVMKPLDSVYAGYVYSDSDAQALNYNNDGDVYAKGSNFRTGFHSRLDDIGPFSLYFNPEFRMEEADSDLTAREAYAVLAVSWLDVIVGRQSQWWGPGHHGAILLSNNAEPFDMIKFTNPEPAVLPWLFRHLGPFQFTFFVTNLEKQRNVPEPYLWGLRFDFKPHPNLEMGLERTALLGGRGRSEDLGTWGKSFFGLGDTENTGEAATDPGDQRAGLDIKWTIPTVAQIYLEAVGEDEYNNLPNIWAFVGGVYLPRVFGNDRIDLRMEGGSTRGRRLSPSVWYNHYIYGSYSYNGNIIGHHIGTDTRDAFIETSYRMQDGGSRIFFFYDREEHNLRGAGSSEIKHESGTGARLYLPERLELSLLYSHAWIRNLGNVQGDVQQVNMTAISMQYGF